jgi:hypothetical protein
MLGGLIIGVLRYLYEQQTRPSQYNLFDLYFLTPVLMIVGAPIGLLIVAWLASD